MRVSKSDEANKSHVDKQCEGFSIALLVHAACTLAACDELFVYTPVQSTYSPFLSNSRTYDVRD